MSRTTKQRLQAHCEHPGSGLARVFTTKTGAVGPPRHGGTRRARSLKPEVQGLESRALLSGFARAVEGGPSNDMTIYRPSNGTWYVAAAAAYPIDQFVAPPTERLDAGCGKAGLLEQSHGGS